MIITKTRVSPLLIGTALATVLASGVLFVSQQSAQADIAPQEKDVLAVGSDIQQNAFNFLADGYHQLPGYNTAGNKWRFFSLDSSGDDNGRSSYLQNSNTVFNPTTILRAGRDNVTRPSGGSGGLNALIANDADTGALIDVSRSPNPPTAAQQTAAAGSGKSGQLFTVKVGRDRDLIAVSSDTHLPATISGDDIVKIYEGTITKVGQLTGNSGSTYANETLNPLYLPSSAGMQKIFLNELVRIKGSSVTVPSSIPQVQQNDPTQITGLANGTRETALIPFPRGRFKLLESGYYAAGPAGTGTYATGARSSLSSNGIKLLDENGSGTHSGTQPFGVDFAYNAVFRKSDLQSNEPWQPGSTLNWVQALFYNPDDGPEPFVATEAGEALLEQAGITPDYDPSLGDGSVG